MVRSKLSLCRTLVSLDLIERSPRFYSRVKYPLGEVGLACQHDRVDVVSSVLAKDSG